MTTSQDEADHSREDAAQQAWTVGADGLAERLWSGESVLMPAGRLHAVSDEGLLAGRAVCLAPVVLLDPRDWRWPDDAAEEWPPCRTCVALSC